MSVYARPESAQPTEPSGWPSPPDPGDLSRRLAARRAELRLSTAQVAARAGITRRYLEYLERYPALPGAAVLRGLAAALLTTPATLLGAGAEQPPWHGLRQTPAQFTKLSSIECRSLIAPGGVGRIAFSAVSGPVVLPVNFTVVNGSIVVRTSEGSLIEAHGDERAAFEVDHVDEALHQGWSVLVQGQAHRVLQPGELRHVRETVAAAPWPGGERDVYVRIVPDQISGRRIWVG
ncbi:MAG TPA: pyridoxamine 5'-phosphate oxidase family protein [Trebonia sp.]|nr:pyridoxamine 5'-phosphate oxidase family protein [Trebonia sp.]